MNNTLEELVQGLVANPEDTGRWYVLADWLEENDLNGELECE